MRTFRMIHKLFLFIAIGLFPLFSHAQLLSAEPSYFNENIGVRVSFNRAWQVSTSYEQAPAVLKPNFAPNKGPNDSPLFIGMHESQQLFTRLLIEPFFGNLDNYAALLTQTISGQGIEVYSAKMSEDNNALELEYSHPQLGLYFKERAALLEDGKVLRMAVWASKPSFDSYSSQIDELFAGAELTGVVYAQSGWQPIWAKLDERLVDTNVTGAHIVENEVGLAALMCDDPTASMLWKIEGQDGRLVYLFGSLHVGDASFYPFNSVIETAFQETDHLVFEVDPASAANPAIIREMQAKGMLPAGQQLSDVVSAEVVANLRQVLRNIGVPADNFMTMQPWFLTLVLSSLQMTALGYSPEFGVESYLASQKPAGSDVLELESIEEQMDFLQELNDETYLNYTLQGFDDGAEMLQGLVEAWRCADQETLTDILFSEFSSGDGLSAEEMSALSELEEMLFYERNITMAEGVKGYLESGSGEYFVVVGSGHLLGERSVIDLLRLEGYQVAPVLLSP